MVNVTIYGIHGSYGNSHPTCNFDRSELILKIIEHRTPLAANSTSIHLWDIMFLKMGALFQSTCWLLQKRSHVVWVSGILKNIHWKQPGSKHRTPIECLILNMTRQPTNHQSWPPFKMGHLYHGYVSHNQRVMLFLFMTSINRSTSDQPVLDQIWANYNNSLTWILRPFGDDFPY